MPRNKHPNETVRAILTAAAQLFIKKGYEQTSLQDIMQQTGLSKGAIYHHFACKEEIFVRVCAEIGEQNARALRAVRDNPDLNGRQKLIEIFRTALLHTDQLHMLQMVPYLLDYPKFLALQIRSMYDEVAPEYIQPILEQGMRDGSLQVTHPRESAEALMILSDVWLHPLMKPTSPQVMRARCEVFRALTQGIGLNILDDELMRAYVHFSEFLQQKQPPAAL